MRVSLDVFKLTLHVVEDTDTGFPICTGEVEITLDSDETAWVQPCSRLTMTEDIVQSIADKLRPLGVKWMRGWHDGHHVGRVINDFEAIGVSRESE